MAGELGGGNSQTIGGVNFTIGAMGAEQAKQQVDATAASVQNLGNAATDAGAKSGGAAAGGIRALGKSMKEATAGRRGLIGGIRSFIMIATRSLGIIGFVVTAIGGLFKIFNEFGEAPKRAAKALREFNEELSKTFDDQLTNELEKKFKELADARDKAIEAVIKNPDLDYRAADAAWTKYYEAVATARRRIEGKALDEAAKANRKAIKDQEEDWLKSTEEVRAAQEKMWEEADKGIQEHMENWDKLQKQIADAKFAMRDFFDDFRTKQSALFNGSQTASSLNEMVNILTRIEGKTGGRF